MGEFVAPSSMQYLDKAVGALRDAGLMPSKVEPAPINALLEKISDLDPEKIQFIPAPAGNTVRSVARLVTECFPSRHLASLATRLCSPSDSASS